MEQPDSHFDALTLIDDSLPEPTDEQPYAQILWAFERVAVKYGNELSRQKVLNIGKEYARQMSMARGIEPFEISREWDKWSLVEYRDYLLSRTQPGAAQPLKPTTAQTYFSVVRGAMNYAYYGLDLLAEPVFEVAWPRANVSTSDGVQAYDQDLYGAVTAVTRELCRAVAPFAKPYERQNIGQDPRGVRGGWKEWPNWVWFFENEMNCTHHTRLPKPWPRGIHTFINPQGYFPSVDAVYAKLGVTSVGPQQLYPFVVQMAALTGLNPTSILRLRVDCLDDELSKVMRRPCLRYYKARSRGRKVTVLEDFEDPLLAEDGESEGDAAPEARWEGGYHSCWMTSQRAKQVRTLVETVRRLTQADREIASPDLRDYLFIYKHRAGSHTVNFLHGDDFHTWVKRTFRPAVANFLVDRMRATTPEEQWPEQEARLCAEIAETSFALHKHRATYATRLARERAPLEVIQMVLGHASIDTTLQYIDRHCLDLRFYEEVSEHMQNIKENYWNLGRDAESQESDAPPSDPGRVLYECGTCHCKDPMHPPEDVRQDGYWRDGEPCSNWNKCLLCEHCVVTAHSLPKLIAKLEHIDVELNGPASPSAKYVHLLQRQRAVIQHILDGGFFTDEAIVRAQAAAESFSSEELDALLLFSREYVTARMA